jgi:hypothetical protein
VPTVERVALHLYGRKHLARGTWSLVSTTSTTDVSRWAAPGLSASVKDERSAGLTVAYRDIPVRFDQVAGIGGRLSVA